MPTTLANGRRGTLPGPPAPRVSAHRIARDVVAVEYEFAANPGCRLRRVRVSVDVNDDGQPAFGRRDVGSRLKARVLLRFPPILGDPDVASVSAVTTRGIPGGSAQVLIRDARRPRRP